MSAPDLVLVLLVAAAASMPSVDPGPSFAAVDRVVEEAMTSHGTPGVSIAIIDDFEVVYSRGFGFAEPGRPVTTDTLFRRRP
jgi:CubicO group peptidase (beta-lactamase class C family)